MTRSDDRPVHPVRVALDQLTLTQTLLAPVGEGPDGGCDGEAPAPPLADDDGGEDELEEDGTAAAEEDGGSLLLLEEVEMEETEDSGEDGGVRGWWCW